MQSTHIITPEIINKGISFTEYMQMLESLMAENKTTGTNHSPEMIQYSQLNLQRMRRLIKTTVLVEELREELANLDRDLVWIVLTEGWCGDAAQIVPVIAEIAKNSKKINLSLLLRDENLEVMDAYLTNGTRSIPKLICLDASTMEVLGTWGPRPAAAQKLVMDFKANPAITKDEFITGVHKWYADNKTLDTQKELLEKIKEWKTK